MRRVYQKIETCSSRGEKKSGLTDTSRAETAKKEKKEGKNETLLKTLSPNGTGRGRERSYSLTYHIIIVRKGRNIFLALEGRRRRGERRNRSRKRQSAITGTPGRRFTSHTCDTHVASDPRSAAIKLHRTFQLVGRCILLDAPTLSHPHTPFTRVNGASIHARHAQARA